MSKSADNIDLTSGAGVRLVGLIYVQQEVSLSLIAGSIHLLLIVGDTSAVLDNTCLMDCPPCRASN